MSGTDADPAAEHGLPEVARAVAIIMDGNGRWAATHGVPVAEGHRAGSRALRPVVEAAIDLGIESLAVYAFSTENWSRSPGEVGADEEHRAEGRVDEITAEHTKQIDDILKHKEDEVMEV